MKLSKEYFEHDGIQEEVRINKYLSDAGLCSRREADRLVGEGRVLIDGIPAVMGSRVLPGQEVTIAGKQVEREKKLVLIAFHKPKGVVCTTDRREPDNIVDYIQYSSRIFPVGRLDKSSEGLILLTNDGAIVNKILRAGNGHEKEYIVTVNKPLTQEFLRGMADGVSILDTVTKPCTVEALSRDSFRIILTQGLNRQIRRMCEYFDYRVCSLVRVRIMNINLGRLKSGTWRNLTEWELEGLNEMLKDSENQPVRREKQGQARGKVIIPKSLVLGKKLVSEKKAVSEKELVSEENIELGDNLPGSERNPVPERVLIPEGKRVSGRDLISGKITGTKRKFVAGRKAVSVKRQDKKRKNGVGQEQLEQEILVFGKIQREGSGYGTKKSRGERPEYQERKSNQRSSGYGKRKSEVKGPLSKNGNFKQKSTFGDKSRLSSQDKAAGLREESRGYEKRKSGWESPSNEKGNFKRKLKSGEKPRPFWKDKAAGFGEESRGYRTKKAGGENSEYREKKSNRESQEYRTKKIRTKNHVFRER